MKSYVGEVRTRIRSRVLDYLFPPPRRVVVDAVKDSPESFILRVICEACEDDLDIDAFLMNEDGKYHDDDECGTHSTRMIVTEDNAADDALVYSLSSIVRYLTRFSRLHSSTPLHAALLDDQIERITRFLDLRDVDDAISFDDLVQEWEDKLVDGENLSICETDKIASGDLMCAALCRWMETHQEVCLPDALRLHVDYSLSIYAPEFDEDTSQTKKKPAPLKESRASWTTLFNRRSFSETDVISASQTM